MKNRPMFRGLASLVDGETMLASMLYRVPALARQDLVAASGIILLFPPSPDRKFQPLP